MTAAVADHKHDVYDSGGTRRHRRVQVDHHAAGAVGIDRVAPGFLPWWREVGSRVVVSLVITLRKIAMAVEHLDAIYNTHNIWRAVREAGRRVGGYAERVFALERRIRAPVVVRASRPGHTAQHRHGNRSCNESPAKRAFHF